PDPVLSSRVAFFGFTAREGDETAKKLADKTTDLTFSELSRMHIDVVARPDTIGVPPTERLARARELGAAYALSGEIQLVATTVQATIRLEDPTARATLWEPVAQVTPAARRFYSAGLRAASSAADVTDCVIGIRVHLSHQSPDALHDVADYCSA